MELTLEAVAGRGAEVFPGLVGIDVTSAGGGAARAELRVREEHLAPNGYLHAGAIVALADTTCGYGCILSLPEGGIGFTTIELKTNFLGTVRDGTLVCEAGMRHGGRTTQIWDATVSTAEGRALALFRCTQLVLRGG